MELSKFHNKAYLYFDDEQFKKIMGVVSNMITETGTNQNLSNAVRYLVSEGLKNYDFYNRYNARIGFNKTR